MRFSGALSFAKALPDKVGFFKFLVKEGHAGNVQHPNFRQIGKRMNKHK